MRILLIFIFCFIGFTIYGQNSVFTRFTHLTTEDGLPQNTVSYFYQDKEGFMWIATGDGLCRYDGINFKIFRHDKNDSMSLIDQNITSIIEDNEGNIWLATSSSGISVMNKSDFKCRHIRFSESDTNSLWSDGVRKLSKGTDGTIWIGTAGGLNYFDPSDKKIKRVTLSDKNAPDYNPDGNVIWSLFVDGDVLWVGTYRSGGLFRLNIKEKKLKHYRHDPGNSNSLSSDYVVSLLKDKNGLLWIGTRNGLSVLDEKTETFTNYQHETNDINSISSHDLWGGMCIDSENNVWIGTLTNGLNLFNRSKNNFIHFNHNPDYRYSLTNNEIKAIYEDRSGLIWIGTYNGINIYNPFQSSFISLSCIPGTDNSLQGNHIRSIDVDKKGKIWLGIGSEGVDIYDPVTGEIRHLRAKANDPYSLPSNGVRDIAFDDNNIAYIVLHGGNAPALVSYDYETEIVKKMGGSWGKSIVQDLNGKLWVGTSTGLGTLDSIDIYSMSTEGKSKMKNHNIVFLSNCDKDHIWVGAGSTLAKFNTKKREFKYFEGDFNVYCMHTDSKGRLWAGSNTGLILYDANSMRVLKSYGVEWGFPNELISSVTEDRKGRLWLGSNYGLICFDPATEKIQSYDMHDGLPNNEFDMGSVSLNGEIYIATVSGLLRFNPDKIKRNSHKPNVVVTNISILNKPYEKSIENLNSLTFSHEQYFFTIEFAALDFVKPIKNQYAYKLVGFNDDWVYIGNKHEVTFTNLNPGEYTLLIKASNNHGVWNDEPLEMKIIILPPWWQTWWFRTSVILFFGLLIFLIFKWRTANLKKQKKILEKTVEERTAEVVEQKEIIEEKQKEIIDSINYAQRLQQAILTPKEEIDKNLKENFLLYLPKDIVAGDFYFFETTDTHLFYAAADCTGHGVPGAMVSIICSNALSRCVYEFNLIDPAKILDKARDLILDTFRKSSGKVQDGMDISLLVWNKKENSYQWAGANNPLWIISDGKLLEIAADKQPIGTSYDPKPFTTHNLKLKSNDQVILFTDGYADQFGGPKGKKFKYSNLQKLLLENTNQELNYQFQILNLKFNEWKGDLEQVDDVCIIGIRF